MKKIKWFVVLGSACLTPVDKVGEGDDEGECTDGIDNDQDGIVDERRDNDKGEYVGPFDGIDNVEMFFSNDMVSAENDFSVVYVSL